MQRFSLWLIALSTLSLGLLAQGTSSVRGVVTDGQSATIADAVVTLRATSGGSMRKAVTDPAGAYAFLAIQPGTYVVEAEKPGFRKSSSQVTLQVNVPLTLEIKMELGQVSETVNVSAEVTAVNTQDASVGNAFNEVQIRQLPLLTRNVVELLSIQPGVTATGEVLGARRDQNNVTLDGVDINDNQNAGIENAGSSQGYNGNNPGDAGLNAALPLPLDSLQEFRVTVAGQGASQGRSAGGQVTLVTKSGTNQFHGSLYEFHRNTATSANNWFSNRAGIEREKLIRNQFGASFGGAIIKNRIFFFANWESRRDASGQSVSRTVPSETLKAGILRFRRSDTGAIATFTPGELKSLDPLGRGVNSQVLDILKQYPVGNDPTGAPDGGLNFSNYRFNAPFARNDKVYLAKMDFNIDRAGKHTAAIRGTLNDGSQDSTVAQFPGQDPASRQLNNSRGIAARYTAVLNSNIINVFNYGFTRLGIAQSGVGGTQLSFDTLSDLQNYGARAYGRIIPTHNITNNTSWIKGSHTMDFGINFRFIENDRNSYENSFASYGYNRSTLRGLGADIVEVINPYLQDTRGYTLQSSQDPVRALGTLYGLVNEYSATYNFGRDGKAVPFGSPVTRAFRTNEYEFYWQDSWKVRKDLTITYGLNYSNSTPPWEKNGVQVNSTVGIDKFFADRVGAAAAGINAGQLPTAALTYVLSGPANGGKPSWYSRDNNNFGPRFSLAYAPVSDNIFGKLFGKGSVFRMGGAMVYDRYGNDLVVQFDKTGSPGLASQVTQPRNTNFTDSARLGVGGLPTLPVAPAAKFPYTPATILGGFNSQVAVDPNLRAPYSFVLNASYQRPLMGGLVMEVGYLGRLSRKQLLQQDYFQPLSIFKDPGSGQTWIQAAGQLRNSFNQGLSAGQVAKVPFFENLFPKLANAFIPGSATQNFFYNVYENYGGSFTDGLNDADRERLDDGSCYNRLGCNTFFALQNAGLHAWTNAGRASYHGGSLTIRRTVTRGFGFDFNYTLAHSIDLASAAESGSGDGGAAIQDAFHPTAFRGSSDFDIRHNITANMIYELPFGKGKVFASGANKVVNQFIGGWQISSLMRYRSGLPTVVNFGDVWPTSYLYSALGIVAQGTSIPNNGLQIDSTGRPSIFGSPTAVNSFAPQYPGTTGQRAILRLAPFANVDIALGKYFQMPWEGHRIQFRAEAFNALNHPNFFNAQLRGDRPSTFGQYRSASSPRQFQFALRYEF